MLLSAPRPAGAFGGTPSAGPRCASPAEEQAMFAQLRARVGGPAATEADWSAAAARSSRRQRALDAYIERRRAPDPRARRPPPRPSKQYCPPMPTTAARDQRLCSGAVRTLVVIRAAIGRDAGRVITKAYLARTLGFSERTVQRHISALKRLGYLTTEAVFAPNGQQIGQRIAIAGAARPFWQRGETELPPIKDFSRNGASRERETAQKPTEKLPSGCCDSVERACGPSEPAG